LLPLSAPNLGSWINSLALLLGYQPRDLEISNKKLYHVLPQYRGHLLVGHIKIGYALAMLKAMEELLEDHRFEIVNMWLLNSKDRFIANVVDLAFKPFPSLAQRHVILSQKHYSNKMH